MRSKLELNLLFMSCVRIYLDSLENSYIGDDEVGKLRLFTMTKESEEILKYILKVLKNGISI